jgi:hypothetical protein
MTWLEEHWNEIVALPRVRTRRPRCAVAGCPLLSQALRLCTAHYTVARQQFDPEFRKHYLATKRERDRQRRAAAAATAAAAAAERGGPADDRTGDTGAALRDADGPSPGTDTGRAS